MGVVTKDYDAFISYNSQDGPAVREVAERLKRAAVVPYLEETDLTPGREFQPALAEALNRSKACVVFLGPSGLGPWQKQEVQVAIDLRVRRGDEGFPVILVLLPGTERPRRGDVAHLEFLINASWVEFRKTLDDEGAFRNLLRGIRGQKPELPVEPLTEGVCPYRGLQAFGPDDARFFFGREGLTDSLLGELRREIQARVVRFLGVLGPSGSGKSSVVLAGLVPKLKADAIEGSGRWPVAVVRPGVESLRLLTERLVPLLRQEVRPDLSLSEAGEQKEWLDGLRGDGEENANELNRLVGLKFSGEPEDRRLLIVVDQFEELFTYRPEDASARERFERERAAYLANLLNAAAAPGGRVVVVMTMRSDFLSACAPFRQLSEVLSAHQELVGPMTPAELREAIVEPAYQVGHEVEAGLAERLLAEVKGQTGALPLLEFALTEVWGRREVRRLTLAAYEELGKDDQKRARGIEGALEHRAEKIYGRLSPADQELCRRIFLRLVQPGEGTEDTKRRVSYRELLPADPKRAEAFRTLIYVLSDRDARLITTEGADATGGWVEVAHEALIRGWARLRQWIDVDRAGLRTQRRLTEAAREWGAAPRADKAGYLYSGAPLAVCLEWSQSHPEELGPIEKEFLDASVEAEQRREQDWLRQLVEHEETAKALLAAGRWAEAHHRLGQALRLLEGRDSSDLSSRRAEFERQYDRVGRVERFHRRALDFYNRAGEEDNKQAFAACQDALDALDVFARERWWEDLPVKDLSVEQAERLKREAYRQLILISGLRIIPGLTKLQPTGGGPEKKNRLGKLVPMLPKVPGLLAVVKLILRPSWREAIFQRLKAKIPKRPEAAADFESALQALAAVRAFEQARAAEGNKTFHPSRISQIVRRVAYLALEVAAGTSSPALPLASAGPQADAGADPTNPVDFYLVGLLHFFIGKRGDSILTWLIQLFPQRFPDVDGRAPLETAELLLRRSIDLETDNFWPYFVLGRTLSAKGDQRGAELAFNSCISVDPDYARGFEQRSLTIALQWRENATIGRRLLARVPVVRSLLSRSAPLNELRDRAVEDSRRAVSRAEKAGDPSTYWPEGELYEALGLVHEALDAYAHALALEEDLHAKMSRGTNVRRLEDLATRLYRRHGTRTDARSQQIAADAQAILALICYIRSDIDDAGRAAETALQVLPHHAHALTVRGMVALRRGRAAEARADLERAVRDDPRQFLAALGLARSLEGLGQGDAARAAFDRLRRPDAEGRQAPEWVRRDAENAAGRLAVAVPSA